MMKVDWSKSKEIVGETAMMAAVRQNGDALRYCHQPSEAVMLAAVRQNGDALRYCHQPSEAVMLAAVRQDWYALQYFKRGWFPKIATLREEEMAAQIRADIDAWKVSKDHLKNLGCRLIAPAFFNLTRTVCELLGAEKVSESSYIVDTLVTLHLDPSEVGNA